MALRIPMRLVSSYQMKEGMEMEIIEEGSELRLRPVRTRAYALKDLLKGITRENLHSEIDTGAARGKEIW